MHLEFDSLSDFLQNKKVNLSHEFTHFVMYIDSISEIHEDGMFLQLGYNNDSEEYSTLYTSPVLSGLDSIVLPIGDILRRQTRLSLTFCQIMELWWRLDIKYMLRRKNV